MKQRFFIPLILMYLLFLVSMVSLNISGYYFQKGRENNLSALYHLNGKVFSIMPYTKALDWLSPVFIPFVRDKSAQRIHRYIGQTHIQMAQSMQTRGSGYFNQIKLAVKHYQKAVDINPFDLYAMEGLCRSLSLAEKPGRYSSKALACFEKLHEMAPNHVDNHFKIARYLYDRGFEKKTARTITRIAAMYPSEYRRLKQESFYSNSIRPAIKTGLETAIKQGTCLRQACFSLSRFYKDEQNLKKAIQYYLKGMDIHPDTNSENQYLFLGRMQLENGQLKAAFETFETAMEISKNLTDTVKRIYSAFKHMEYNQEFLTFAGAMEKKKTMPLSLGIYIARARIKLGLFELAKARLIQLLSEKKMDETYYLLSVIAREQKDWDAMELNIQKAIVLEPSRCRYYKLFAQSLGAQGKKIQAAVQVKKARECTISKKK